MLAARATMTAATVSLAIGGLRGNPVPTWIAVFSAVITGTPFPPLIWVAVVSAWTIGASGQKAGN